MTSTHVPDDYHDMVAPMQAAHETLLQALAGYGIEIEPYPDLRGAGRPAGAAAARAYPIQGVLKYHGMADWTWRTAYLPSISFNNDAAYSLTLVEFDPAFAADDVTINGQVAAGRDRERVVQSLDAVRSVAGIDSRARVVSRNVARSTKTGKGLGTSASASAALAMAAIAAAFGPEAAANTRFLSCMARLLAGSGCRSAVGGISLWLSYPGIPHEDGFAVRLDNHDQLADMRLITIPLDSRIGLKTEMAHHDAPHSAWFKPWMRGRLDETLACMAAIHTGDWRTVGQLAELDSIQLHAVTMTGGRDHKLFAWEPEDITLFRLCNDLRAEGVPVYFSTDTGPTVVLMTHRMYEEAVVARIQSAGQGLEGLEVIRGQIAGPAVLVPLEDARHALGLQV